MNRTTIVLLSALMSMSAASWGATGRAQIAGTSAGSTVAGLVQLTDTKDGLKISVQITNAPAGTHGIHIHEAGDCGDSGKSAGGHYNPMHAKHGNILKDGAKAAHKGDLGNITIGADGKGTLEGVVPHLSLSNSPYTVGGRAFILHEKTDDFGQPVGNAGGRIGCGVIVLTGN